MEILHLSGTSILITVHIAQLIFKGAIDYNYKSILKKII